MAIAHQAEDVINNQYCIVDILGKGGVAVTYRAIDLETNSPVAIKVISLKQLSDWKQVELFEREAEVLAKLDHRCIPKYIDYFAIETATDKLFYIVQELAPGKSLFELVESGWRTSEAEVKKIAQQILEILIYLHSQPPPVIHRDLKPNNIIRSDDGTIYLVDFGAVQNTYYDTLMQGSTVVGTYGYMAPEQFRGKAVPATDLYSLGATILYLLTHRSPSELPQDTLKLNFRSSVNISDSFANWLEKLLEPGLEDRFADAEMALAELSTGNKVKRKRIIATAGIGVLCLSVIWGAASYKWFFLSRLGFYPAGVCQNSTMLKSYLGQTEKANDRVRESCLYVAQNKEITQLLLEYGADANARDDNGRTLLHIHIIKNKEIAQLLLKHGADVNAKNKRGEIALHTAENKGVAQLLLEHGADANARDNNGKTPLHITENKEIAQLLLEHGADVNAKDRHETTPLHWWTRREDVAQLLLEHGADVNAKDNDGRTPLRYAVIRRRTYKSVIEGRVQLLLEHGAKVDTEDEWLMKKMREIDMLEHQNINKLQ